MEQIINSLDISNNINIIGNNIQLLQKVLKKYDTITVNSNYISYVSSSNLEEIPYNDNPSFYETKSLLPDTQSLFPAPHFLRLKNTSDNFEYIGLSNQGSIIKIAPLLYNDIFVRIDNILAFSETVDLIEDKSIQKTLLPHFTNAHSVPFAFPFRMKPLCAFCLVKGNHRKPLCSMQNGDEDDIKEGTIALKRDYLYLSSGGGVVEKRLGENEQIIVMKNGVIAFERSVSFYTVDNKNVSYVNKGEDVLVEGPGLIIFHTVDRVNKSVRKGMVSSFIVTFLVLALFEFVSHLMINLPIE